MGSGRRGGEGAAPAMQRESLSRTPRVVGSLSTRMLVKSSGHSSSSLLRHVISPCSCAKPPAMLCS